MTQAAITPDVGVILVIKGLALMGGIMISEQLLNNLLGYLNDVHETVIKRDLYDRVNRKAALIDPIIFEDTRHLDDIEKAKEAIRRNVHWFTWGFIELFSFYLPFFIYMTIYLYRLRPILPLLFLLIFIPAMLDTFIRGRIRAGLENKSAPLRREAEHYEKAICAREYAKETRQLGAFSFFFGKYMRTIFKLNKASWKAESKVKYFDLGFRFVLMAGYIGIVLMLVFSLKDGFITIGAFAAVFASVERFFDIVNGLVGYGYIGHAAEDSAYVRNLMNFFRLPERDGSKLPESSSHAISLQNVSFRYPGRDNEAVSGVSLEIRPNETIALVGENGAGKSTLVRLMTGMYLPTAGKIFMNGVDTKNISMNSIFQNISGVFQKFQKYKLTARENIIISDIEKKANEKELSSSLDNAGVELESSSFPEGFDTILSREFDGVDLSGGQWQRIAIARGFYRTNNFIVLDEPTAAIDPIEETFIYKRFMELSKGKTAVLVTHRLGSAKIADRIIVMDGGRIVEEGTHDSLMARGGRYNKMFTSQSKWYTLSETD